MKLCIQKCLLCVSLLSFGIVIIFFKRDTLQSLSGKLTFLKKDEEATLIVQHDRLPAGPAVESTVEPTADCTEKRFEKWKGSSTNGKLKQHWSVCDIFQGRFYNVTGQCKYYHPNTVHYIKYSNDIKNNVSLCFREYVSILSVDRFYKPDKIIIHANNVHFSGVYWDRIMKTISTPIEIRHTERVSTIDGKKPGWITHEADYIKVKIALSEGGIYMDFDTVILNGTKLRQMQEKSEFFAGNQCKNDCHSAKLNAGFFSCIPNSSFVQEWLHTAYEGNAYRPSEWDYNCGEVPAKILCRCPKCFDAYVSSEVSNWDEALNKKWLEPGGVKWQGRPAVHYMNKAFMKPLKPPTELLRMNNSFTDMIKHVLGDTYVLIQ